MKVERLNVYDCIRVGDWVRFMQDCQLVIGQVDYIVENQIGRVTFYTSVGSAQASHILEHRHAAQPGPTETPAEGA